MITITRPNKPAPAPTAVPAPAPAPAPAPEYVLVETPASRVAAAVTGAVSFVAGIITTVVWPF